MTGLLSLLSLLVAAFPYPTDWQGVKFRGSALLPHQKKSTKTTRLSLLPNIRRKPNSLSNSLHMPRNKVSNDLDHVRKDPVAIMVPKEPPSSQSIIRSF